MRRLVPLLVLPLSLLACGGPRAVLDLEKAEFRVDERLSATLRNTGSVDLQHEQCRLTFERKSGGETMELSAADPSLNCDYRISSSILGPDDEQLLQVPLTGLQPGEYDLVTHVRYSGRASEELTPVRSATFTVTAN